MLRTAKPRATFIGRFYHALEQKGRLSVPSSFRRQLQGQAVLTSGLDGCLFLLDGNSWQTLLSTAQNGSLTKRNNRDWTRYLANNAAEVTLDAQGRILIPEHLRAQAKLKDTVVIVGSIDRIEIWDQQAYHRYLESLLNRVEDIAESINPENT